MAKKDLPVVNTNNPLEFKMMMGYVKSLKNSGPVRLSVTKVRPQRSNRQNNYYHGVVLPYAAIALEEANGEPFDVTAAHEECRALFLKRKRVNRITGEVTEGAPRSTADLDTAEFSQYIEEIIRMAAMVGVEIPPATVYVEDAA